MGYSKDELAKTLLVTHKNCPDGCGCAVVFRAAGGLKDNVEYVNAGHGVGEFFKKNADYINSFDLILIADVAPDEETAIKIEEEFSHVICIDHHKTARFLEGRDWCTIDMSKCGTLLLFEHLFGEFDQSKGVVGEDKMKKAALHGFAVYTNDRDMWLRQHRISNEMSMMMDFLGQERYVERALEDFFVFGWKDHEKQLLEVLMEKKDRYIESAVEKTRVVELDGKRLGYVFISNHQSDVLSRVLEVHEVDAAVGIILNKTGVVSVRSSDDFDAANFCKEYGGGGHARAAGHSIDDSVLDEIIAMVHS